MHINSDWTDVVEQRHIADELMPNADAIAAAAAPDDELGQELVRATIGAVDALRMEIRAHATSVQAAAGLIADAITEASNRR